VLRETRWTLVGVGLLMLVAGGVSIFSRPARELLYDPALPAGACSSLGCVFLYRLEVGNTGREPLEQVLVRLRAPVLATAPIRPSVRDFGKFDRPAEVSEAGGVRTYALGRLNPEDRVDLSFVLRREARQGLDHHPGDGRAAAPVRTKPARSCSGPQRAR